MELFSSTPLSSSGRPILLENEVELKSESHVSVALQENKKVIGEVFAAENNKLTSIGWAIMLKAVSSIEDCARTFRFSTRFRVTFHDNQKEIGLRFEKDGKDEFLQAMHKALDRKSWEKNMVFAKAPEPVVEAQEHVFSSTNAGVAGIIRRQERNLQSVDNLAKSALTDLDALMLRAREAIAVVQRYASYTAAEDGSDALSETTSQVAEKNEMETIMQNIGIVSPVTKFSAGRKYHEQLARQMADLLLQQGRLDRLGGMITLTDLYCLFNRARGTELVSPDDLLKAATLTGKLHLGLKLRVFNSGVKVLQADSHSEEALGQRILTLCRNDPRFGDTGLQASDLAVQLNISLVVAKEQLLMAESNLFVCRDESTEGLFFYPNLFEEKWSSFVQ